MAAKIVLFIAVVWVAIALITWAAMRYGLPEYLDYKEEKEQREHKREMKKLERDEKLVEEAENEYEGRR